MTLDITKELQTTFHEAVMQHEARSLKQGQDWEKARNVIEQGEIDRADFEEQYHDEYDTRIEIVRKRLVNEAGEFDFDHPAPGGRDKFDSEAIDRQAHREVQHDHERVLQQSRDIQGQKMQGLQETARQRDLPHGKAKEQFTQASDRRKKPDRRTPIRSR